MPVRWRTPSLRTRSWSSRHLALAAAFLLAIAALPNPVSAQTALDFDGTNDYVTFGQATSLGLQTFTLECWFKREGAGVTTSTGSGGITSAIPLVTKGRGEAEGGTTDMNYFLGIRSTDNVLGADFEDNATGLNHPVFGVTPIATGTWYHAAATYNGTEWRLYLNGALEATGVVGAFTPQNLSVQHAGIATGMTTAGVAAGFFNGLIDEVRIWSVARTQEEIAGALDDEIVSATGLVGRWGLDEGSGTSTANSGTAGAGVNGTLTNGPVWVPGSPFALPDAIDFAGTNAYVNFGAPASLALTDFTIEMWIRRDGTGTGTDTGTGGIPDLVPLFARGRADVEDPTRDINYMFGIRASDGVLAADFEEGAGGASPSLNHPVAGSTVLAPGTWYHVAATYDGATWKLYVNGALDAQLAVGQPVAAASTVSASLASALRLDGTASGFFNGVIDEVRVWNVARTGAEINATINTRLSSPAAGLVGRWGLDEGAGTVVHSAAGTTLDGTITGTGWAWSAGAPFDIGPPSPPAAPSNLTAAALSPTQIRLDWSDNSSNEEAFDVERSTSGSGGPFTSLLSLSGPSTYTDGTVTAGNEYCYRVRARNSIGPSAYSNVACATPSASSGSALDLGGTNAYASFGNVLKLSQFTLELWFRRDGTGAGTNTGTGGIPDLVPILAKGRADAEEAARDINYIFGIRASDGVLAADFEEGAAGGSPSLNHPVAGVTPVAIGGWHHGAVTYDGATWRIYLDGNLDAELAVGQPAGAGSDVAVSLGSALTLAGAASGFFDGAMDEVRVWNVARTQAEIQSTANIQISTAQAGLVARWALNEGSGTAVTASAGTAVSGTITGAAFAWTGGAPFGLSFNLPPSPPALVAPAEGGTGVARPPVLTVTASDPDDDPVTVTFYGRPVVAAGPDFTLVGIPDTQYYTSEQNGGSAAILNSQMQWIIDHVAARNIRYAVQLGDCTEHGDNGGVDIEWQRADAAFDMIEDPLATGLAEGLPYGICVGNHDQSPMGDADGTTTFYNQYFGSARFQGRAYYGGHYGSNNDNWYELFSASGMDFIVIEFEYDATPDAAVLAWADQLLTTHSDRRAIVVSHNLLGAGNPGTFSTQGSAVYNALRGHSNLFLMLCGHVSTEGRRQDTFAGNTVHTLMSDYQSRANGGNGWLRILEFSPANDVIRVRTYSPWLDQFEADADSSSQFTLSYPMSGSGPFQLLGTVNVASGGTAQFSWAGLDPDTTYEWYATVGDGFGVATGPVWSFRTAEEPTGVALPALAGFALSSVTPNPSHGAVRMAVDLPVASPLRVQILDVQGRVIATLADGTRSAGRHELTWRPAGTGRTAPGLYLVRMQAADRVFTRRFVTLN